MLTTAEIQAHLATLVYKPGWALRAYDGAYEGQHLVVTTQVEDSYRPGETMTLDVHCALPPMPDVGYLETWLGWRLRRLEAHESLEFLRRADTMRPVVDPHRENADRDLWD